jgi:hypothetical protein
VIGSATLCREYGSIMTHQNYPAKIWKSLIFQAISTSRDDFIVTCSSPDFVADGKH